MSHFLAQTNAALDRALEDLRRRLGVAENQEADLLRKLTTLAAWVLEEAEQGRPIEAREVLALLDDVEASELQTTVILDDDEAGRLAIILEREFAPTPALRGLLASLADPNYEAPQPQWPDTVD